LDNCFALAVEGAGCLIEQHQPWPADQTASDAKTLPLATAQLHRGDTRADQSVVSLLPASINR
jgi:hypothetical protein